LNSASLRAQPFSAASALWLCPHESGRALIPTGAAIGSVQPYVLQGAAGGWRWSGNWQPISALRTGAWNTLAVQVPQDATLPSSLDVQFTPNGVKHHRVYR
jgi:hypothetical protein